MKINNKNIYRIHKKKIIGSNLEVTTEKMAGSGLYLANNLRAKFALYTDQCISRLGSLETLITVNIPHFSEHTNIKYMPIPVIFVSWISQISYFSGVKW